jgi:hypothetical protein
VEKKRKMLYGDFKTSKNVDNNAAPDWSIKNYREMQDKQRLKGTYKRTVL